ncbi:Kazal peptide Pr13a-like [Cloeon dipterum]|uniref:Kazal peptide Pr13a-like n=1 Tax=Cloeon dipterum TaxID=197152 RepID=UPI0032202DC3
MKFFAIFFAVLAFFAVFASADEKCGGKCRCTKDAVKPFCAKDSNSQNKLTFENECKLKCWNCQRGTAFTFLHDGTCH